jgi:hypothetical protein
MRPRRIPEETTNRLFTYLRPLMCLRREGTDIVSSQELAAMCDVHPAVVRKDFSYVGTLGTRGVGYKVDELIEMIRSMLRFDREVPVAVVGVGHIGEAVLEHTMFEFEGFRIAMAFDSDPERIGRKVGKVVIEIRRHTARHPRGAGVFGARRREETGQRWCQVHTLLRAMRARDAGQHQGDVCRSEPCHGAARVSLLLRGRTQRIDRIAHLIERRWDVLKDFAT